jgi:hypothetical protein
VEGRGAVKKNRIYHSWLKLMTATTGRDQADTGEFQNADRAYWRAVSK